MALEDDATDGSSLFNRVTASGCSLHASMITMSITELQATSNNSLPVSLNEEKKTYIGKANFIYRAQVLHNCS